jgi:hypothetical protein
VAAQIERHRHGVVGARQQEGDGSGARRVALESLADGAARLPRAVAFEQVEQLRGLLRGRFAFGEGPFEQGCAFGNGKFQAA